MFVHDAALWSAAHPIPDGPLMLVNSWNELGEGQTVIPTQEDGYAYGQALAEGVGVPWSPPPQRTITVTASKGGTIRSIPAGIGCPSRCTISIANGTQLILTATPHRRYSLVKWTGACAGQQRQCTSIVDGDTSVRASFKRR